jgi:hypothetical protein
MSSLISVTAPDLFIDAPLMSNGEDIHGADVNIRGSVGQSALAGVIAGL